MLVSIFSRDAKHARDRSSKLLGLSVFLLLWCPPLLPTIHHFNPYCFRKVYTFCFVSHWSVVCSKLDEVQRSKAALVPNERACRGFFRFAQYIVSQSDHTCYFASSASVLFSGTVQPYCYHEKTKVMQSDRSMRTLFDIYMQHTG